MYNFDNKYPFIVIVITRKMFPFDDVIMGTILVKNNNNAISTQLMITDNVNRRCRITADDDVTTLKGFLYHCPFVTCGHLETWTKI